jgi:hypothetical protein
VEEDFLINVEGEERAIRIAIAEGKAPGGRIWQWVKSGVQSILNVSTSGLASTAETVRKQLEEKLGGKWDLDRISVTLSKTPSATIVIVKKS